MRHTTNDLMGICVLRREGESMESMIKRFKRKCTKAEIIKEVKSRQEYEKPSVKRKRKSQEARRRKQKDEEKLAKTLLKLNKMNKKEND